MRITEAEVIVCSPGRNFVTSKITTDDGVSGIGDATLNGRELAVTGYLTGHIVPLLIGRDAAAIEDTWQYLYHGAYWRRGPVTMSALSAVDMALRDITGKELGAPVHQLLGGPSREAVLVYGHASRICSNRRSFRTFPRSTRTHPLMPPRYCAGSRTPRCPTPSPNRVPMGARRSGNDSRRRPWRRWSRATHRTGSRRFSLPGFAGSPTARTGTAGPAGGSAFRDPAGNRSHTPWRERRAPHPGHDSRGTERLSSDTRFRASVASQVQDATR